MKNLLKSVTPLLPLITKMIDAKKGGKDIVSVAKNSSYGTEGAQATYGAALYLIAQDVFNCGLGLTVEALSCITGEHWGMLVTGVVWAITRARSKNA